MTRIVLDASAILAAIYKERGHGVVTSNVQGAAISVVNWCEALGEIMKRRHDGTAMEDLWQAMGARFERVQLRDARWAAELLGRKPRAGLSLGDRLCLATAHRLGATALTADGRWTEIDHGVEVELIR